MREVCCKTGQRNSLCAILVCRSLLGLDVVIAKVCKSGVCNQSPVEFQMAHLLSVPENRVFLNPGYHHPI
jgi:hypothetical protein